MIVSRVIRQLLKSSPKPESFHFRQISQCKSKDSAKTLNSSEQEASVNKVTIVGSGQVGMACVFSLLALEVTEEVAVTDVMGDKVQGEVLDIQHGSAFLPDMKINGSSSYEVTKDSKICVITAGARQKEGESRLHLLGRNVEILKFIIPNLLKYSPDTILMLVTNPVDIMAYAAWKISKRPLHTVFGTGTSLDTARLKYLLSEEVNINIQSVHVWIVGEHGDSSVPVWSNLLIGGISLKEIRQGKQSTFGESLKDDKRLKEMHNKVVSSAYDIIKLKGYTSWAIGLNVANICKSIIHNTNHLHALSTLVKGSHGVDKEVFLSLPCSLGRTGIKETIPIILSSDEQTNFVNASKTIYDMQSGIEI